MRKAVGNENVIQEQEFLVVRPVSSYINEWIEFDPKMTKIPRMEAICKNCWKMLVKEDYVMMKRVHCKCRFNLIHNTCEAAWSAKNQGICPLCKQMAHKVSVTLSPVQASVKNKKRFSCFKF